ncbi:sigma 54-interacting transcriptional regulator [Desulfospira joergensenii]|uniref:sigma 54-interacting transcriptional regulator n=1 Tax=Desulfospira joergensenii TaxID=53329 RepID=UPI0003B5B578|nr:sigma 54-interacting transcriptional regulator [Desulfospira joergensenii]
MPHSHKRYRFALVSHSEEISRIVRQNINHETETLFTTVVGLDDGAAVAETLIKDGYEVIIVHSGTGRMIAKSIGQPVVIIPKNMSDIVTALLNARELGNRIGITSISEGHEGFETIRELLKMNVREIVFHHHRDLQERIEKAVSEGVDIIVGGGLSRKIADQLDVKSVIVKPGTQNVREAIKQARSLAAARRMETEHHQRLQTILNVMDDGMICVDAHGYLNFYNKTAETILGMDLEPRLGRPISDFTNSLGLMDALQSQKKADKIIHFKNTDIVVTSLPVLINDQIRGAVSLLKEGSAIHGIDRKLRERIYKKGFIAKHRMKTIVAIDPNMQKVITKAKKFAQTEASILVYGETGTGKEFLSHALHNESPRKKAPFVAVNCAALSETLLESELFGYEEGAFTGAKKGGKIGLFELADQGTIFLDEIGDISSNIQVRLLRILESKEVIRVGGDRIVPVDVRIISSTHRDLREEVRVGRFRKDLYYRLAVLRLTIPPLRNRTQDIPELLNPLLKRHGKSLASVTSEMLNRLQTYWWPGNIRELNALMESYLTLLGKDKFSEHLFMDLFEEYKDPGDPESPATADCIPSLHGQTNSERTEGQIHTLNEYMDRYRLKIITHALRQCGGNKTAAAKQLGISTNTLWRIRKKERGTETVPF